MTQTDAEGGPGPGVLGAVPHGPGPGDLTATPGATPVRPAEPGVARSWRAAFFAPVGDGSTRRRGSDAVRVVLAVLAVLCCWLVTVTNPASEHSVVHFLDSAPRGVQWLLTLIWVGCLVVIAALVVAAAVARRLEVLRDVAVAALGAWFVCFGLQQVAGTTGGRPADPSLAGVDLGFPVMRIAVIMAVVTASLPYLSRVVQRSLELLIVVVALVAVVRGSGMPVSVLASLAVGWGVTAAVHLAFGSPLGLPSGEEVAALLGDLGIGPAVVEPLSHQIWGVARYRGCDDAGPLDVAVYGRDAADAQLVAKALRFVFYRDSGPTLSVTRLQQVEHQAYLTLLAGQAGADVPTVVAAGTAGPSGDALFVTRPPGPRRLDELLEHADGTDDERAARAGDPAVVRALDAVFAEVLVLRAAGIAHGSISPETLVLGSPGGAALTDYRFATARAPSDRLDRDVAGVLATAGLAVGPEAAVAAAHRVLPDDVLAASLPHLGRAALDPVLSADLRGHKDLLAALREQGASAAGVDVPELAEPRRVSWPTLLLVIGSIIGGWALIGVLVDVSKSFDTLIGADWGWVVAVFLLAQLAYPALAVCVVGSVTLPVPYGRAVALEVANTFVALAGGTMGVLATRVRFFQQEGYTAATALNSGVLVSSVSWIVKGGLFLIALPFAIGTFNASTPSSGGSRQAWVILVIVVVVTVAAGVVLAVPRWRRFAADKLRPRVSQVWTYLKDLSTNRSTCSRCSAGRWPPSSWWPWPSAPRSTPSASTCRSPPSSWCSRRPVSWEASRPFPGAWG